MSEKIILFFGAILIYLGLSLALCPLVAWLLNYTFSEQAIISVFGAPVGAMKAFTLSLISCIFIKGGGRKS